MANIKQESFGKLSDGREAKIFTLRNNKGNELKVTDYGARIVSIRFRDKSFKNKFVLKTYPDVSGYEKDATAGIVFVDEGEDFSKIIWNAQTIIEGVKFTAEIDDKHAEIIYSISNDNEVSITYEATGAEDISTQLVFSADELPTSEINPYAEGATNGLISGKNIYDIIDKPAEVLMEVGMFGYDPGCPIDYLEAGLKNAADIFSAPSSIDVKIYATQNKLHVEEVDGGFAIRTSSTKSEDGKIKSQTVYVFKNRK
ncbi:MAG: hypothetical protein IKZ58_05055 [Selenomonadaceae bacterium]|nr:hypothetical protein [Selenomonadaceae bacterium]